VGLFTLPESFNEGPVDSRVKTYMGDRNDTPALRSALEDYKPDIVFDFVCFDPSQAEALLPIITGKVSQFVFVSTVDVYGYPLTRLPFRESDPMNPPNCDYAANKRLCEEVFHRPGLKQLPLTIVRPVYSFGNHFVLTFFSRGQGRYMITRLRNHMPILVSGDGTTLIHASSSYNTGRMIARVAGNLPSIGKDYTVGHKTFMTHDDYVKLFARLVGEEPVLVHIPTEVILGIDSEETRSCLLNILTRFNIAFSMERFQQDFPGFEWSMSLEEWGRRYIEYNDRHGNMPDKSEVIYDDKIIAAWQGCIKNFNV
jgi:nucleoside-diphosphate-sugar epimerase